MWMHAGLGGMGGYDWAKGSFVPFVARGIINATVVVKERKERKKRKQVEVKRYR